MLNKKFSLMRFVLVHAAVAAVLLFIKFVYRCPLNYFFRIPCPGCGLTRACTSALMLDFKQAFESHPLFFLVIPTVLYFAHCGVLKRRLKKRTENIWLISLGVMMIIVYFFRMTEII